MMYATAILGGFAAAFYLFLGLVAIRAIVETWRENRQPLAVREAQEVAAQAWRVW